MNADPPICGIIAGPNGAGKTAFALKYLPEVGCQHFVNADLIVSGMSPLAPERERVTASRIFLAEIERNIVARHAFAFETTLAGQRNLRLIRRLKADGWRVELLYLALPNVEMAKALVAERPKPRKPFERVCWARRQYSMFPESRRNIRSGIRAGRAST